jgi:hypothetical protein
MSMGQTFKPVPSLLRIWHEPGSAPGVNNLVGGYGEGQLFLEPDIVNILASTRSALNFDLYVLDPSDDSDS